MRSPRTSATRSPATTSSSSRSGGPYPRIIGSDEEERRAGVEGARDIVRLAARMGVPEAGVRPTSHNPRGDCGRIQRTTAGPAKISSCAVRDLPTAFDSTAMIDEYFDACGGYCSTVQIKDVTLEDRFVVHISETIAGTGVLGIDLILRRTEAPGPDTYAVVEHLPVSQIGQAKRYLAERAAALGIGVR